MSRGAVRPVDRRLLRQAGAARGYLAVAAGLGLAGAALILLQADLLSRALAGAARGTGAAALAAVLGWLAVVLAGRAVTAAGGEAAALRAAAVVKSQLRRRLSAHVLRLGPAWLSGQQAGEITTLATRGLDALDAYFARYLPRLLLAVAGRNLPAGTPLHQADMACFRLDASFDAVVCAYQGVNHLLRLADWESFFDCVRRHLNGDGVFVFDIATVGHLLAESGAPWLTQQFGGNYLRTRVRAARGAVFDWQIEVFELQPDGSYRLLEQTVRMRSFPVARILQTLARRFINVEVMNGDGLPAPAAGADEEERIWFACTSA